MACPESYLLRFCPLPYKSYFNNLLAPHPFVSAEVPAQTVVYLQKKMENIQKMSASLDVENSVKSASLTTRLESLLDKTILVLQKK